MTGYLIGEEGPLTGLKIAFSEGDEWVLGRDPEQADQLLEDPMVSRTHVIVRRGEEGLLLENLSSTNPALINGESVTEQTLLHEDDTVQIGNTFFRYSEVLDEGVEEILEVEGASEDVPPSASELKEKIAELSLSQGEGSRWLLKVIAGPNTGAEFGMNEGESYVIGKDANSCDIFFQDLSVSRQHAKVTLEEDHVVIEDLSSRNGVLVNGVKIERQQSLGSQDLIALGTTAFLVVDRNESSDTLYSPSGGVKVEEPEEDVAEEEEEVRHWKDTFVPTKHLVVAGSLCFIVLLGIFGMLSLFRSQTVIVNTSDQSSEIGRALRKYKAVEYNYNDGSGKLFLLGHVLTEVNHQEMLYVLHALPFVHQVEDNVVIDELVSEDMNALLFKNPNWRAVMVVAQSAGKFQLKGYLKSLNEMGGLIEYVNGNFPYLDLLDNQVVVETNLETELQAVLIERGFVNVTFQFANGELVLAGRVHSDSKSSFERTVTHLGELPGIHDVKNYVIYTGQSTARVDLSSRYNVTGTSKVGNTNQFVLINGRILSKGDTLDGMTITSIHPTEVLLERDGLKYKIDYNLR